VDDFGFSAPEGRPWARWQVAVVLFVFGIAAPVALLLGFVSDGEVSWSGGLIFWAIGAVPCCVIAAAASRRPRLAPVVVGLAIAQVLTMIACYAFVFTLGSH
jgi:hypothetical protein